MLFSKSLVSLEVALFTVLVSVCAFPHELASRSSSGSRAVGYYVNWAIYARNYMPAQLPASKLTHVLYAFANVDSSSGNVVLSDTYADLQKHFPGDSWDEPGNNVYGCVKQLYLLKKANRNMKTLLSIGGWTYSPNFAAPLSTAAGRQNFVNSSVSLMYNLGFDGLDIDYEYPSSPEQAADFITTLQLLRKKLDSYAQSVKMPESTFLISVASPAGPTNYKAMNLAGMDPYVDFWNLMAYDYAGSWSQYTGHDANMYPSPNNPNATPYNTQQALMYYRSTGKIAADKINLGIPLYGRSFTGTTGMGQPYTGLGVGTWQAGVYDWKDLPLQGSVARDNMRVLGSRCYDNSTEELVSYDGMNVMKAKAQKVLSSGLGGLMWWETSADRNGSASAIATQVKILAGAPGGMEQRQNVLNYPDSEYDNLRAGMPSTY